MLKVPSGPPHHIIEAVRQSPLALVGKRVLKNKVACSLCGNMVGKDIYSTLALRGLR
jgi:hypothetical protein